MKNYLLMFCLFLFSTISVAQTTQLNGPSCGATLITLQDNLYAVSVPGATNYQYHITNSSLGFDTYYNRGSGSTIFRMGWVNGVIYNTTYQVEVRAFVGGSWTAWGATCNVTTPVSIPQTKIASAYCGITLSQLSDIIYCDNVSNATNYEYRVTNSSLGYLQVYQRGSGSTAFSLSWLSGIQFNTTYDIEVRASINGNWGSYGTICQVTTPSNVPLTQLDANSCGKILTSINEIVYCNIVNGATNYEYRIINASIGFNTTYVRGSSSNSFSMGWVNGVSYGYTYNIEVRSYINGQWTAYGNVCQLTVPAIPTTQLNASACGATLNSPDQVVYVNTVQGASNYEYSISNSTIGYNTTYLRGSGSNAFSLSWVPGIVHGHTYNIQVRAYVNNSWGNYGNVCQLTAVPKITMQASSCNKTLSTITEVIFATAAPNATRYEYNVYNDSLALNHTYIRDQATTCCPTSFALNMMNGIKFDTPYKIRVRAFINNTWGTYGNSCDLMSPNFPQTSFIAAHCGITLSNNTQILNVQTVYNVSNFEYTIVDPITSWTKIYYRGSGSSAFSMAWVNGIQNNTTYNVSVKAFVNGAWGPAGPVCTVTTAGSARFSDLTEPTINSITIYPNPANSKNDLKFVLPGDKEFNSIVIITSLKGEIVYRTEAANKILLTLPDEINLESGMYVIKVINNNKLYTDKFTIL